MENININDYMDYEHVTIAKYKEALFHAEKNACDAFAKGEFKKAAEFGALYFKLNNLLNKRLSFGHKYGYDGSGRKK